jgi:DNA-binding LacI/PurR family transcriptional regulator
VLFGDTFPQQGAIAYAERWQAMPRAAAPTAVMCGNDTLALEFLRVVLQHGVRVPDEVSVVGFDGVPEGALYWPGLTTAKQPSQALGNAACRALMQMIESPDVASPERIDLPAEVIVRESSGPRASRQEEIGETGAAARRGSRRRRESGRHGEREENLPPCRNRRPKPRAAPG